MSLEGALAAHRFGLGARPGEIEAASGNPKAWLTNQLDGPVPRPDIVRLPSTGAQVAQLMAYIQQNKDAKAVDADKAVKIFAEERDEFLKEMAARFVLGFTTDKPFAERLVWFWSNHFTVSAANPRALAFIGAYEREAIRPRVLGKFEDLVLASARHPAMLLYLNNAESIGPDSLAGKFAGKGLNENYGRELMELHTLGVDGGYTQGDVIALAKILTGWSLDRSAKDGDSGFRYYPARHEPGDIKLLGKTYPASEEGGILAIRDLANHPATARHIAKKFANHFVAENPPQASIDRLTHIFTQTHGDLHAMTVAALDDPLAWKQDNTRIRQPVEYVTATARALAWPKLSAAEAASVSPQAGAQALKGVMNACKDMGQFPFTAPAPTGFDDISTAWSGPDAVLTRIEWANTAATGASKTSDPMRIAGNTLGPLLTADTKQAIQRAASGTQGLALVFASPEFQRR